MNYLDGHMWEAIGAVAGVICAVVAILGLYRYGGRWTNSSGTSQQTAISNIALYLLFLFVGSIGWTLSVVAFVWIFEPFGAYITSDEYKKIYGVILAFPALALLRFALNWLPRSNGKDYP